MNIQVTELKTYLEQYLDATINEPIIIENGHNIAVIISFEQYNHFLRLEDFYWGMKALEAEKEPSIKSGLVLLKQIMEEKGFNLDNNSK